MKPPACAAALALSILLAAAGSAHAWVGKEPGTHHETLAILAAERLPEPQRTFLLETHREAYLRGAWEPDANVHTFWHTYDPANGGGGALYRIEEAVYEAATGLREDARGDEVAYRMGQLTHFALDLAVPFHTAEGLYDEDAHLRYERAAQHAHDTLRIEERRAPREVADVRAHALALAEASAREADPLLASLDGGERAWSPEAADITSALLARGIETTADLLATAFARGDPARPAPEPTHLDDVPQVREPEDVGLGGGDLRRLLPWEGALLLAAGVAALAVAVVLAAHARRAP